MYFVYNALLLSSHNAVRYDNCINIQYPFIYSRALTVKWVSKQVIVIIILSIIDNDRFPWAHLVTGINFDTTMGKKSHAQ